MVTNISFIYNHILNPNIRQLKKVKEYSEAVIKVPRFEESAGFYTTKQRSKMMSSIKGKDTKPELEVRKALWKAGTRYRVNYKFLPGRPDISNRILKFVVFIDGEFWHGYNWEEKKLKIKTNRDFWIPKIERNMQRDRSNDLKLNEMGYKVFHFWEHEVKKELDKCVSHVKLHIKSNTTASN